MTEHWSQRHLAYFDAYMPEVRNIPKYLLSVPEVLPDVDTRRLMFFAGTSSGLEERFRPVLEQRGEWRGPGFMTLARSQGEFDSQPCDAVFDILLHEFSHYVDSEHDGGETNPMPTEKFTTLTRERHDAEIANALEATPWGGHDYRFIRTMAHLNHRARRNGAIIEPAYVLAGGTRYGLSHYCDYARTLAAEVEALQDVSIFRIADHEPPFELFELFVSDARRWRARKSFDR